MTALAMYLAMIFGTDVDSPSWVSFRNGGSSTINAADLPLTWSPTEGIAWQRELPGYGQSSPVTWGGRVYVTAVVGPQKETCVLLAINANNGEVLWRVESPASSGAPSNYAVARAAPTPVVDDRAVYAFFEGGDVLAVSHDGHILWKRSLVRDYGEFDNHHGLGASPVQTAESLVLNIQHDGPSYLISLDKRTGETKWRTPRKSCKSWSSPIVLSQGERTVVVVSAGGSVEMHDASTGEELWTMGGISGNNIPSPTYDGELLFLGASLSDFESTTNAARSNVCLKPNTAGGFDVLWRAKRAMCDYASPVVAGNCVYYVNRVGVLYCLDRVTGSEHYAQRLPGPCWATPIVAHDRIYFFGKNGVTAVVRSGAQWKQLAVNRLWEESSPPVPETYVETVSGPPAGGERPAGSDASSRGGASQSPSGFAERMLRNDANGDGKLVVEELPEESRNWLTFGDKNGDSVLDGDEIRAMGEEFRKRRENSRMLSRDPIVYGVAATDNAFYVRTGTRLYCITNLKTDEATK